MTENTDDADVYADDADHADNNVTSALSATSA